MTPLEALGVLRRTLSHSGGPYRGVTEAFQVLEDALTAPVPDDAPVAVEVAYDPVGHVLVRNAGDDGLGPILTFEADAFAGFLAMVKRGDYDR